MAIEPGQAAPEFVLAATAGRQLSLAELKGRIVVLYFYPRDNTPGCTKEAEQFAEIHEIINQYNGEIVGISRDSIASHEKFKQKLSLPFYLLSDPDGKVCEIYGVLKEKNMYGKKSIGIERSTFIIDKEGIVKVVFRKVKVEGHAADVITAVKQLFDLN